MNVSFYYSQDKNEKKGRKKPTYRNVSGMRYAIPNLCKFQIKLCMSNKRNIFLPYMNWIGNETFVIVLLCFIFFFLSFFLFLLAPFIAWENHCSFDRWRCLIVIRRFLVELLAFYNHFIPKVSRIHSLNIYLYLPKSIKKIFLSLTRFRHWTWLNSRTFQYSTFNRY